MYGASLHCRLREDALDRFWQALEPVHAGDEDVRHAPRGQFIEQLQVELLRTPRRPTVIGSTIEAADGVHARSSIMILNSFVLCDSRPVASFTHEFNYLFCRDV